MTFGASIATVEAPKQHSDTLHRIERIAAAVRPFNASEAYRYGALIHYYSIKYSLSPILLVSIIQIESGFKNVDSPTGTGLMQVVYSVHRNKVKNRSQLLDPQKNIEVGAKILSEYDKLSRSETEMLSRYNGTYGISTDYAKKVFLVKKQVESRM